MPTVKLTVADITVELTANETSTEALAKQALDLCRDAARVPARPTASIGFARGEATDPKEGQ
jgi:hypothetical protein